MADNSDSESQSTQAVAEVPVLVQYLRKIIPLLLEDGEPSVVLDNALEDKGYKECMKKFLTDQQTIALMVERNVTKGMHTFYILLFLWRCYKQRERC